TSAAFPTGIPAGDVITFDVSGFVTDAAGNVTPFAAGAAVSVPAGGIVTLDKPGTLTFQSGADPLGLTVAGIAGAATSGQTTISPGRAGVGLTLSPNGSLGLPSGSVLTFSSALPSGDTFTSIAGMLTIPAGATGTASLSSGNMVNLPSATSVTIPTGDSITI